MRPVLTAEEARALERAAEERGTSVETLMERAGHAVARAAEELAGGSYGRRAVVVCGKGNNAGDGFVAARRLDRWGMRVTVLLLSGAEDLREPAATNLRRLEETDVRVEPSAERHRELERADVAIDAIFGLGLAGGPREPFASAIRRLSEPGVPVVAVDIPSGVDSDTGAIPGAVVRAAATVTFGAHKVGTILPPGAEVAGSVRVADIGYPSGDEGWPTAILDEVALPEPRPREGHKRQAVVLVVAGSRLMTGAPVLVAAGAYRAGAGLVTVAVPESILPTVQEGLREATFIALPESSPGVVAETAWDLLADLIDGVDAVAVGPGLSTEGEAGALARRIVRESPVPVVADADAINAFAGRPADLADRKADVVITPHAGELARLLGMASDEVRADRPAAVRAAAAVTGAPVALKGWRTLVCEPGGRVRVNTTGTPVLATAGTGDVLTGLTAAFAARERAGIDEALRAAVHVHGLAGRHAGARLGEGTTASDVAEAIAEVVRELRGER